MYNSYARVPQTPESVLEKARRDLELAESTTQAQQKVKDDVGDVLLMSSAQDLYKRAIASGKEELAHQIAHAQIYNPKLSRQERCNWAIKDKNRTLAYDLAFELAYDKSLPKTENYYWAKKVNHETLADTIAFNEMNNTALSREERYLWAIRGNNKTVAYSIALECSIDESLSSEERNNWSTICDYIRDGKGNIQVSEIDGVTLVALVGAQLYNMFFGI